MDVTNPGLVNVANQSYDSPLGVDALLYPTPTTAEVADDAELRPTNDVGSETFPTPTENLVSDEINVGANQDFGVPVAVKTEVNVMAQSLVSPNVASFLVVGPNETVQTNTTAETEAGFTVTAVQDADSNGVPGVTTTRYRLFITPTTLTAYPFSFIEREMMFNEDTTTTNDRGAVRNITGYANNYIVINKADASDTDVPSLTDPVIGDTFIVDTERNGPEVLSFELNPAIDVTILPSTVPQDPVGNNVFSSGGSSNITTGPQPGSPIITGGVAAPTAINVEVANQPVVVGLPVNVYV
jgi:hypothetical protein